MAISPKESLELFKLYFEQGQICKALQALLISPEMQYDNMASRSELLLWHCVNYADAAASQGVVCLYYANLALRKVLEIEAEETSHFDTMISILKLEEMLLLCYLRNNQTITLANQSADLIYVMASFRNFQFVESDMIESALSFVHPIYRSCVLAHLDLVQKVIEIINKKPALKFILNPANFILYMPWYAFYYPVKFQETAQNLDDRIPCVFFEPLEGDYQSFLSSYINKQAVFVFETRQVFIRMLHFKGMIESILDENHFIYILEEYPTQLFEQGIEYLINKSVEPIFLTSESDIQSNSQVWLRSFVEYINQPPSDLNIETPIANRLYQVCKHLIFNKKAKKYGMSRSLAFTNAESLNEWHDSHKGASDLNITALIPKIDFFAVIVDSLQSKRSIRSVSPHSKIKLAHIVPQLVDVGHAPSKLLRSLTTYYNPDEFELFIIVTERGCIHLIEYPLSLYNAYPSSFSGAGLIERFSEQSIPVWIASDDSSYEKLSVDINQQLQEWQIDVAVYHGPDMVNVMSANQTDVPSRVLFEHGSPPSYPGFDLAIFSSEEPFYKQEAALKKWQTDAAVLFFSVDCRQEWEEKPYSKSFLGVLEDSFIMTTISNHLSHRLSADMCKAIAEILQRCPKAYYMPMGIMKNKEHFHRIFENYGVKDRVVFLGAVSNPSQYARSMEMYLNEFPFGSCLAMLDAMASGCVVVSMYDQSGPPQARYAGNFLGLDHVISSGLAQDYVNLACQLINDKTLYREWSNYSKSQYDKRADTKAYVKDVEELIKKSVREKSRN